MNSPIKKHTAENGNKGAWVVSTEAILGVLAVLGIGGFGVGHVVNNGASKSVVQEVVSQQSESLREYVKAVVNEEENTWTIEELIVRDAKIAAEKKKEDAVQHQIDEIEIDMDALKKDVVVIKKDVAAIVKAVVEK